MSKPLGPLRQIVSSILISSVMAGTVAMAQAPYWDNSGDPNQIYYTPGTQQQGQPTGASPYPSQSVYGQPSGTAPYGTPPGYGSQPTQPSYYGQGDSSYSPQQPLRGYVSTAPVGTPLSTTNTTYLSSDRSRVGDPITATLGYDLAMGGNIVLPAGSQIHGQIVSAVPAGRTGRHGELQLRFNRAVLPDGRTFPLSARLVTPDGSGIIRGGTRAQRAGSVAKNTLGGAAIGAASGTALGAIVGGGRKWNEGLLWGSILGAGGGLVRSGVQRGQEAELQPGTQLQLMLDQPLTVTSGSTNPY